MSQRLSEEEYHALKQYVLKRDHWRCRCCKFRNNLSGHHVIYRSQQGPDTKENLAALCSDCHDLIHQHKITVIGDNADVPGGMKFLRGVQ